MCGVESGFLSVVFWRKGKRCLICFIMACYLSLLYLPREKQPGIFLFDMERIHMFKLKSMRHCILKMLSLCVATSLMS